jgi:hypothetical protein
MPNQVIANPACNKRVPWNEGKLSGANRRSDPNTLVNPN